MEGALERTRQGWKEVKLGAIVALATRGTATTAAVLGAVTYIATLAPAQAFGAHLRTVAQRRGLGWAQQVVILGDGARWIWKLAARRFGGAIEIVDWFHAHQHLWALAQLLYGEGTAAAHTWLATVAGELWAAETTEDVALLAQATDEAWATPHKDLPDGTPRRTKARHRNVVKAVAYFTTNATRMRYGTFRAQGLPVRRGCPWAVASWKVAAKTSSTCASSDPALIGTSTLPNTWSAPAPSSVVPPPRSVPIPTTNWPANSRNYCLHPVVSGWRARCARKAGR